jgi:hypothetical protein
MTFAVIPDDDSFPVAYFASLEVAIDWGLRQYGSGAFRIRGSEAGVPLTDGLHRAPDAQPLSRALPERAGEARRDAGRNH